MNIQISFITVLLLLIGTTNSFGQQTTPEEAVIQTLESFHQAIIDNDSQKARILLSDSVRILESGKIETKQQYLSHHFHSDGTFLSSMKQEVEFRTVKIDGNIGWVTTKSHLWGTYNDRELNLNSLELAVLKKTNGTWKISALHWSSSSRK